MTPATLAVIGSTEIVLIVVSAIFMLGVGAILAFALWKLVNAEQAKKRGAS
jgi:hypothetical protein